MSGIWVLFISFLVILDFKIILVIFWNILRCFIFVNSFLFIVYKEGKLVGLIIDFLCFK